MDKQAQILEEIYKKLKKIEQSTLSAKDIMNTDEAANYTRLSKSYLFKLTSTGGIPCYKPHGKLLYFKRSELEDWMLQNRKMTNKEIEEKAINLTTLK